MVKNNVKILVNDFDYVIEKPDVFLIYVKSGKCWVCKQYKIDGDFVVLELA